MLVATAFGHTPTFDHEGKEGPFSNAQLAVKWLDWCAKLGGLEETELVILGPAGFELPPSANFWKKKTYYRDGENTRGWPSGPNSAFRQLAWNIFYRKETPQPWLFCEPDCIPLRSSWLAELEEAYLAAGKPFMGARIAAGKNFPEHMSGNAIYPANAVLRAPSLVSEKKMNVAWDIRGAAQVLPQMAPTDLIFQLFRHPKFNSLQEFRAKVPASAVLFHSDKYGAICDLLAADRGIDQQLVPEPSVPEVAPAPVENRAPVFSTAELCEIISANIKSETARTKLMNYLRSKNFHQRNFGAAIKELALNAQQ